MLCDARTREELHRRQIPSLRGKNLQWRSVFTSDFVLPLVVHRCRCSNQDGSAEQLPEGMKAEVVGRHDSPVNSPPPCSETPLTRKMGFLGPSLRN